MKYQQSIRTAFMGDENGPLGFGVVKELTELVEKLRICLLEKNDEKRSALPTSSFDTLMLLITARLLSVAGLHGASVSVIAAK